MDPLDNNPKEQPDQPVEPIPEVTPTQEQPSEAEASKPTPMDVGETPIQAGPSRVSRFFRTALRWAVMVVVLFALGVLTTYYLLYLPALEQSKRMQSDLASAKQQLTDNQKNFTSTQDQMKSLQTKYDQVQADLTKANNQVYLQMVYTDIANARLALFNKDGTAARTALLAAQTDLNKLLPAVKAKDGQVADALSGRLTLALNELIRDPRTALSDLDVLSRNLQDMEKLLFP